MDGEIKEHTFMTLFYFWSYPFTFFALLRSPNLVSLISTIKVSSSILIYTLVLLSNPLEPYNVTQPA